MTARAHQQPCRGVNVNATRRDNWCFGTVTARRVENTQIHIHIHAQHTNTNHAIHTYLHINTMWRVEPRGGGLEERHAHGELEAHGGCGEEYGSWL